MASEDGTAASGGAPTRTLAVLGPTIVRQDGRIVVLRPREREVLAALAVEHPRPVAAAAVIDMLWPVAPPATAKQALQNHVARIRTSLGSDAVVTDGAGYRLGGSWTLDLDEFDSFVRVAARGAARGDHALARVSFDRALQLVRGRAFADLPDSDAALPARTARDQTVVAVEEDRMLASIAAGELAAAIAGGRAMVSAEPYREARWAALALALYLDGQRRESVQTLQQGRDVIREVSGLDVGPAVAHLERLILDDDPVLRTGEPSVLVRQAGDVRSETDGLFLGRTDLLADIRHHLGTALDRAQPLSLAVVGDVGMGKSTLGHRIELQASLDGWHVIAATCHARPVRVLEPLGELARQAVEREVHPGDVFDADALRDAATLWAADDRPARGDVAEAALHVLARVARRSPTLIVVDDAHHMSASVRRLLRQLLGTAEMLAIVLLGAPHEADGLEADVVLPLDGLDLDDTKRLVDVVAETVPSDETLMALHLMTGGNPSLVREAALDEAGASLGRVRPGASIWRRAIEQVDPILRRVATWVAVAGGTTSLRVLVVLLDGDDTGVQSAVDAAAARGILRRVGDDDVAVASAAMVAVILEGLDDADRLDAHEAIGAAHLALGDNHLAAAPHLLAAADRDPLRAITSAERAAAIAFQATMYEESADLCRRAITVAEGALGAGHPRTLSLLLGRSDGLRRLGDPTCLDGVWTVVHRARENDDVDSLTLAAAALCKLGPSIEFGVGSAEVAAVVEEAVERCRRPALRAYCAGQATLFHSFSGRTDLCRAYFELALSSARETGDDRTLLAAIGNAFVSLNHPEDWPWRAELASEMLMLAERVDDDDARCEALHLHFASQIEFCDPLLRTTFQRQETLARSLRSAPRRWMAGYQRACIAHLDGRFDDALAIHEELLVDPPVAMSRALSTYWMNMLSVRLSQGRGTELAAMVDAMVADYPTIPGWRSVAAWLAALAGDHDRVRHECELTGRGALLLRDQSWSGAAMLLGRAVAALDDPDLHRDLTALLAPHSGLMTWVGSGTVGPFDLALAELALAADDRASAARYLDRAQRSIDRLNAVAYQHEVEGVRERLLPIC